MLRAAISEILETLPFLGGKNPSKQNLSHGSPELTNAGTKAVAPGSVSTPISCLLHSRDSRNPGSLMPGVPASVINAIFSPDKRREIIGSRVSCSLNLWWLTSGVVIPKCFIITPDVRVSSARTRAQEFSTSMALGVMSDKLPTGVGTMKSFPLIL
ncbi:unknown [Bacteroides sp. CAG:927]|nr:unknown [Bacteroides sp. CAG:927]